MKILHVLAQLPARTGSGVYFSNVIEGLALRDHEQRAVFALQDEHKFSLLEERSQYPVHFKSDVLPFPIVGMSDVMPYDNTVYSQMTPQMIEAWTGEFRKTLLQAREEFSPDIVIAHHLWMLTSIVLEVFGDAKIVGVCHNTDIRQAEMHPDMFEKYVKKLNNLDLVFALSELAIPTMSKVFSIDKDKIVTIGGGFNQNVFYPDEQKKKYGKDKDKIELVFSAKIDVSKGIYELIDAFQIINKEKPYLTLDIIGTPKKEYEKLLEEKIAGNKKIKIFNVKDQAALADLMREKDIFIMPSYFEGLGLMAIETLATGLFVVATEIEGLMSLLGKKVEESGVIKYVKMPGIYDLDKPVEKDLPDFIDRLRKAILVQTEKVERNEEFSQGITDEIWSHCWANLSEVIAKTIEKM